MKTGIDSNNFLFSYLEQLMDKVKFEDLLVEINELKGKKNLPLGEELVYDLYKTKTTFFFEGETKALKIIERVLTESKQHEYILLHIEALLFKTELLRLSGDRPSARKILDEVEVLLEPLDVDERSVGIIKAKYNKIKGSWFLYENQNNNAIKSYKKAIEILMKSSKNFKNSSYQNKEKFMISTFYHQLAVVHNALGELDLVKKYTIKGIKIKEELNDQNGLVLSWMALGNVYRLKNDYVKAEEYFKKALDTSEAIKYYRAQAYVLANLVTVYTDPENSERNIEQAYDCIKKFADILKVNDSENIKKIYQQALANVLSYGTRYQEKLKAIEIYKEIIADNKSDERLRVRCMSSLCNLYLEEYEAYKSSEVLDEIITITEKILSLAEDQDAPRWLIEALRLKSEIVLLESNFEEYTKIIESVQEIAEVKGISEYKNLSTQKVKPETFNRFSEMFNDSNEGLTKNHLRILLSIVKKDYDDYQSLRESLNMTRTTFFRAVKELVDFKLVLIDTSLEDARKRIIILQDEGKDFMRLFQIITTLSISDST